jgi:hypothetical protein
MERRRKNSPSHNRKPHKPARGAGFVLPHLQLPHIDEFTEHGQIVIGYMEPVSAVAIAEGRQTQAMLRRRKDEPFRQLLMRLVMAIASGTIDDVYIDEVNTPQN